MLYPQVAVHGDAAPCMSERPVWSLSWTPSWTPSWTLSWTLSWSLLSDRVSKWLDGKSETFSALCGETFTRREVLLTAAACMGLVLILGVAGWLEGGVL